MAGGFRFPNVPYSYAKVYYFNLFLGKPHHMDFRVYKDGVYAASKLGNGHVLSEKFHEKLQTALARGADELIMGLSKCFMPRHGIIYYDENDHPVASLSICFECEKISVWSKEPYRFTDDYNKFDYKKAEKQMKIMGNLLINEGIAVYKTEADLEKYQHLFEGSDSISKTLWVDNQTIFSDFPDKISKENASSWIHKSSTDRFSKVQDTLIWEDGKGNRPMQFYRFSKTSFFLFDNNQLYRGVINANEILLPNGISPGMSIAEVYQKLNLDQPEQYATELIFTNNNWKIQLYFQRKTLFEILVETVN